ncbi:MAG: Flp/Fap pilin component [Gaiellaceae bacterium]|jgi:pilus assembly protein Flp/PilA|nr:Flp/Fap pilin component [Gaiellaceae bacterium]MDX6470624.1 Flp/Fap pilin component [Gaiellaceae bacterium]MDX6472364.1 Flp/Fap pilin component [Gaiellaceae bacterium]
MFASFFAEWIKTNLRRDEGQTMAEYGLILAVIAVVVVVTMAALGSQLKIEIQRVVDVLP